MALSYNQGSYNFSSNIKEKGSGEEKNYFNKQDQAVLKNLLKKMSVQAESVSEEDKKHQHEDQLIEICKKHGIKAQEALLNDLVEWKFE